MVRTLYAKIRTCKISRFRRESLGFDRFFMVFGFAFLFSTGVVCCLSAVFISGISESVFVWFIKLFEKCRKNIVESKNIELNMTVPDSETIFILS